MKKIFLLLAVMFSLSSITCVEASACKKRAVKAITDALQIGAIYAGGCVLNPPSSLGSVSIITFDSITTPYPSIVSSSPFDNAFIFEEPGNYQVTFGGFAERGTIGGKIFAVLNDQVVGTVELSRKSVIQLPVVIAGSTLSLVLEGETKTAFVVIQRI